MGVLWMSPCKFVGEYPLGAPRPGQSRQFDGSGTRVFMQYRRAPGGGKILAHGGAHVTHKGIVRNEFARVGPGRHASEHGCRIDAQIGNRFALSVVVHQRAQLGELLQQAALDPGRLAAGRGTDTRQGSRKPAMLLRE